MARSELERTVQQPLLDRLIDLERGELYEPPISWEQSVARLRTSLKRDLDWLLNTRQSGDPVAEEFEELARSLYEYGLPDVSSMSGDSVETRARLVTLIERAIADFEPRLASVTVSQVQDRDPARREIHLLIEAMLRLDPNPEPVVFDTVLEIASGEYHLSGDGSA